MDPAPRARCTLSAESQAPHLDHQADVEEEGNDGSFKLAQPITTNKSVYKHLSSPPQEERNGGWFKKVFSWFF